MNVLAIETSGAIGAVAACRDHELLAEESLERGLSHGRLLVSVMDAVIVRAGWNKRRDIELIAVSQGPGSFTGLRVGITAAKTLAVLTGCPIIGVCSLDAMAENAPAAETSVLTILDAKRGEVYAASYRRTPEGVVRVMAPCVADPRELAAALAEGGCVMGDGLDRHADPFIAAGCRIAPESEWRIGASTVARLGLAAFRSGERSDPLTLQPIYLRLAEAEEKRLARERGAT